MTQRRCQGCRTFYDKKLGDCPDCGQAPYAHNKWLVTAQLNGNLNDMHRSADRERKFERSLRSR